MDYMNQYDKNMPISNIAVYDLKESILASQYPMIVNIENRELVENDFTRVNKLVKASKQNGSHGQFLTGIRVNFDLTFSNKAWVEAERYRFLEFVSSQSTMHRISKFDISSQCNEYVEKEIIDIVERLKQDYLSNPSESAYLKLLYNIPSGFKLTARVATNYRCLLNIYAQRYNHRLPEWQDFCKQLLDLPYFKEFVENYV